MSDSSPMTMYAIPPYMLEQIRQHGPDELRAAAAEALARSDSLRSERIAVQSRLASGELSRPDAAVSDPAVAGRRVFDAGGSEVLPGTLARSDADPPTGDAAVDEAFAGAGLTYFFYRDEYQGVAFHDDRGGVHLNSGIPRVRRGKPGRESRGKRLARGQGPVGCSRSATTHSQGDLGDSKAHGRRPVG